MDILMDSHKELLKSLVKIIREGTIPEEFFVKYIGNRLGIHQKSGPNYITLDGLSRLGLEALTRAGYIFSLPSHSTNVSCGVHNEFESSRACYVTPDGFRAVDTNFAPMEDIVIRRPPVEISSSLNAFRMDFPDPSRLAFIMMRFGNTSAHKNIHSAIRNALDPHQFIALRADDKQYHDDLFLNILTYIYGCRFGIAVFERIEKEDFNPNISLEVGYMLGLGKAVCYLKDQTIKTLQSDLICQLYRPFDPQDPANTIPTVLWKWMTDKGFMSERIIAEDKQSL